MRNGFRLGAMVAVAIFASGCSQVVVRSSGDAVLVRQPDWQQRLPFFMYGLVGQNRVDAVRVCGGRPVEQVSLETTFWDGFFKYATLLTFTPKTAKVWCRGGRG